MYVYSTLYNDLKKKTRLSASVQQFPGVLTPARLIIVYWRKPITDCGQNRFDMSPIRLTNLTGSKAVTIIIYPLSLHFV